MTKLRWIVAAVVGAGLALAASAALRPRTLTRSPDGVWELAYGPWTGAWYLRGNGASLTVGNFGDPGRAWFDWEAGRLTVTDMEHRMKRGSYGVTSVGGVVVERRSPAECFTYNSPSGHVVKVFRYNDARGSQAAYLRCGTRDPGPTTLVTEGPWSIDVEWSAPDELKIQVHVRIGAHRPVVAAHWGSIKINATID